jgi:hypothetical protein
MNVMKISLFNKSSYMRGRCEERIFVIFYNLVDLLFLDIRL